MPKWWLPGELEFSSFISQSSSILLDTVVDFIYIYIYLLVVVVSFQRGQNN